MIELGLRSEGYEVSASRSAREALEAARTFEPNVVLTDINMGTTSGLDLCRLLNEQWPDIPVVVITAFGSMETAILAMRAGAYDFITKPFDIEALALAISRAFQHHQLKSEVKRLRAAVGQAGWGDDLIGTSAPILELRALLERIAHTDATVLVTGETGTGKEVVARVLHQQVNAATARSWLSTAPRYRKRCSRVPSSATCEALSRTRARRARVCSWRLMVEPCFWMKSAKCRRVSSPSCCAPWRRAACGQ